MKKNNLKLSLLLIFLLFIGLISINSCQEETVADKTTNKSDEYFVNDVEACNFSEKLIASSHLKSLKSYSIDLSCGDDKILKSITSVPDKNKLTAMYIINYEPGGFAILSADKRLVPILAYSSDNPLAESSENCPPALEFWLTQVKERIEAVRSSNEAPTKDIQQEWKKFENGENDSYVHLKTAVDPDPGPTCTETDIQKGPLLTTKWDQGCGFNSLLKQQSFIAGCVNVSMPCNRAYAGCVAIAMAQVMKYYQRPTSFNWSQMPNQMPPEPYPTEPARLIDAIDAKDALNPDFKCGGTASYLSTAASVLKNKFGYSSATYASYNSNTVLSNVSNNKPVILGGGNGTEGHAWVCDGYWHYSICVYDDFGKYIGSNSYLYFKMNWGYKGQGDGVWYAFNNFNPTIEGEVNNFNSNVDMVYNITP